MELVYIIEEYTDFLRTHGDNRVSFNREKFYKRPYVGIVFKLKSNIYFAPLTSSNKGTKLKSNPKKENMTFFPLADCKLGGININNMIPVVDGVYHKIDFTITDKDNKSERDRKMLLINQKEVIDKFQKDIRKKAVILYNLKTQGKLYKNYDDITCDFIKLEAVAVKYKKKKK